MELRPLVAILATLSWGSLKAADPIDLGGSKLLWERSLSTPEQDFASAVAVLPSGNAAVVGGTYAVEASGDKRSRGYGMIDSWLTGISPEGQMLWDLTLGGSGSDVINAIAVTRDGRIVVVGDSDSPPGPGKSSPNINAYDLWVVGVSPDGVRLWDKTHNRDYTDTGRAVCLDSGSGFFVAGDSGNYFGGGTRGWLLHLDSEGNRIWDRYYGPDIGEFKAISAGPESQLFVGGFLHLAAAAQSPMGLMVARVNPDTGDLLWKWAPLPGSGLRSWCTSVCASRDGGVIAGGVSEPWPVWAPGTQSGLVVRLNEKGEPLWQVEFHDPETLAVRWVTHVLETDDGGVMVTGFSPSLSRTPRMFAVRLGTHGEIVWWRSYGLGSEGYAAGLATGPSGDWWMLATAYGESPDRIPSSLKTSSDLWLLRLSSERVVGQLDPAQILTSRWLGSYLGQDGFHFSFMGMPGQRYVLERSASLSLWTPFSTNVGQMTNVRVTDPAAASRERFFYRARPMSD